VWTPTNACWRSGATTGKFDADHRELPARQFPGTMLAVPHRVFAIIAESKGSP
jgi:hypothetical protein